MTDKEKLIQAENILHDICMSFETEGCEGCGTVNTSEINKARDFLGWDRLDDGCGSCAHDSEDVSEHCKDSGCLDGVGDGYEARED